MDNTLNLSEVARKLYPIIPLIKVSDLEPAQVIYDHEGYTGTNVPPLGDDKGAAGFSSDKSILE